jgi:hypothetical protein
MNRHVERLLFVSFAILWAISLVPCPHSCVHAYASVGMAPEPNTGSAEPDVSAAGADDVPVCINELMAANSSIIADPQGRYEDWIELHNTSKARIDVGGLYLTNDADAPTKWQIPAGNRILTTIPAEGFLVIWADGDTTSPGLHASFKLSANGDSLYLFNSDGITRIDSIEFGVQIPNVSYGRYPDASAEWQILSRPTPGAPNIQTYSGIVGGVRFSHERGFYDQPFEVALTCDTPGAAIYYTTDGSEPYREGGRFPNGKVYAGPLRTAQTTCLRARAVKPGWRPSDVVTQTYIFIDQVVHQSIAPPGFPGSWGGVGADYAMDPGIVTPRVQEIKDDLKSLPTMSLVMTLDDLFGATQGIYANPNGTTASWERPASIEMIWPDGQEGFQANCGARIYGDVGRQYKKKTFRLLFKGMYGQTSLRYPLFGDNAAGKFDTIILRANFNDGYPFGQAKTQYLRDEYSRRLQLALGQPSAHGTYVHLYVNGLYWGLYNPVERPDAAFAATYYGGAKEDWDAYNSGSPTGGSTGSSWNGLLNTVRQGVQTNQAYQRLQGNNPDGTPNPTYVDYLDVDNYIDYVIVNFFVGNTDWPHKNWYGAMNLVRSTGFKCFCWDTEWVMDLVLPGWSLSSHLTDNVVGVTNGVAEPYGQLRQNVEFRLRFADHVHRAFFNGGPLYVDPSRPQWDPVHPESNRPAASYAQLASSIERAMLVETARWGDVSGGAAYNITQWRTERDYLLNTYMVQRPGIVMGQFRSAGLYPNVDAPVFQINGSYQHGGHAAAGAKLSMTGSSTIWYTLDGSDPRVLATGQSPSTGGGSVSTGAVKYVGPITLNQSARVKARTLSGTTWSALNEAVFAVGPVAQGLRVSELMYHPANTGNPNDPNTEFIELTNIAGQSVNLNLVRFTQGIDYTFPSFDLPSGRYCLVVKDIAAFQAKYSPKLPVVGQYAGSFSNDGERVELVDAAGQVIQSFEYKDSWFKTTDGQGFSLTVKDPKTTDANSLNDKNAWRPSASVGGSPGANDPG